MDTAKTFKPRTILLWRKIASRPDAQRILDLFPSAQVQLIEHQRMPPLSNTSPGQVPLESKRTLMIGEASSFVGHFDGRLGTNLRCRPYYKLVPLSNGCPYYCTYCYLAFIYRKYAPYIKININYDTMFRQIRKVLADSSGKICFNMGEMLDSLALDHITNLTTMLIPFFSDFSNAYLMLLTKSSNIDNLLALKPNQQTVVSWSLNPSEIITRLEQGTASLNQRIEAAKTCQNHGYRTRFRIDPGILYTNWRSGYSDLLQKTLTVTEPENITIGMLRLLPGHLGLAVNAYGQCANMFRNCGLVKGASDGKLRYPPAKRIEFYRFLIDVIRSFNKKVPISLCRESTEVCDIFKNCCESTKCNCIS